MRTCLQSTNAGALIFISDSQSVSVKYVADEIFFKEFEVMNHIVNQHCERFCTSVVSSKTPPQKPHL